MSTTIHIYEKGPGNGEARLGGHSRAWAAVCQRDGMKMNGKLYHGACFYPELWDEDVLDEDIRMMERIGINVVRIGEFAWSRMEPEKEGSMSDFADVIRKLRDNKLKRSCARRLRRRRSG
ncbi:beta-galactosidase [Bacillus licheniformis]|nr:beta-galactosidase [Bacillus licheniformis]